MRVIELICTASEHLESKGFENPRLEVEYLLGNVLGMNRLELYMAYDRPVKDDERDRFRDIYRRRLQHEPLQHIVGTAAFRELELKSDRRALVPRPETEVLVEHAVNFLRERVHPRVADLGTGSGVIALSIAHEVQDANIVAVDISQDALDLASSNARILGLEDRVDFIEGDMLAVLDGMEPFDMIVSNPPYVPSGEIPGLDVEVRDYDPMLALDGGPDGLGYLRRLVGEAHRYIVPGGVLILECDHRQAESLVELALTLEVYCDARIERDLAGMKRLFVTSRV